jgi:hypothetical protein
MNGKEERKSQFLNKEITIKRVDNTFLRGICVEENEQGITVQIRDTDRVAFVPLNRISEITFINPNGSDSHD